jgi:hypothetical protein
VIHEPDLPRRRFSNRNLHPHSARKPDVAQFLHTNFGESLFNISVCCWITQVLDLARLVPSDLENPIAGFEHLDFGDWRTALKFLSPDSTSLNVG